MALDPTIKARIEADLHAHPIVLYMKGTPSMPLCGFSAKVIEVLQRNGATFESRDVLEDESLRQGIKEYANWPTVPQLYVNGELVGGCDIVVELDAKGELSTVLQQAH